MQDDPLKGPGFGIQLYGRHSAKVIDKTYLRGEARGFVAAVAKGLTGRLTATAEKNGSVFFQQVPSGIPYPEMTRDLKRSSLDYFEPGFGFHSVRYYRH